MAIEIFDRQFRKHPVAFVVQSLVAMVVVMLLMLFHTLLDRVSLLASLGASVFIALAVPHRPASSPRKLIGGYVCGLAVGLAAHLLVESQCLEAMGVTPLRERTLIAGVAVGVVFFLMVILNMEHPPAASITLALALEMWLPWNAAYVLGAIIVLSVAKELMKPLMRDLL